MRRLSILILLLLAPALSRSQPVKHGDPVVEIIGADEVNVRDDKAPDGEVIAKVQRGDRLKRLSSEEGWFKVGLPDGREGWINGRYGRADIAREVLVVTASAIKLRRNPSTGAPEVTQAMQGDELKFLSDRNNWYFVQTAAGQRAWVPKDFVAFKSRVQEPAASPPRSAPPQPAEEPAKKPDLYQEGLDLLKIGNEDRALDAFQNLLRDVPNHGGAHFEVGRILKNRGRTQEALEHFQKALTGDPKHPEAQFYIEELRKSKPAGAQAEGAEPRRVGWIGALLADDLLVQMVLYGGGLAALLFIAILLWTYRRRRRALAGKGLASPRKDAGFEATLKAASDRRPLLKVIEEAEKRQEEAEDQIRKQFEAFGGVSVETGEPLKLPEMEPIQALLKKVEEIRQVVVEQEERARMYTDLIQLQNGKIEALNDEIEALKKLVLLKEEEARREKPRPKQKV